MPRFKLTVAYDGTNFHGWQKQSATGGPEGGPIRTVQETLEQAVRDVVRESVSVLGASRTDTGVHARGQVAVFDTAREIEPRRLRRAITSRLPGDVIVRRVEEVDAAFDPIRDCIGKGYRYRLAHSCQNGVRPLFDRSFVTWTPYRLDPVRMNEAARALIGEHDFASFTRLHHGRESTVRTVYECRVDVVSSRRCVLSIAGSGFLHNMIRIVAGTLQEIGRGRMSAQNIEAILADRDRRAAGPTLPPQGLFLQWVRYRANEAGG